MIFLALPLSATLAEKESGGEKGARETGARVRRREPICSEGDPTLVGLTVISRDLGGCQKNHRRAMQHEDGTT